MRGIVAEFADGRGVIKPLDASPEVLVEWRAIQVADKTLTQGDVVEFECTPLTGPERVATVVFRAKA